MTALGKLFRTTVFKLTLGFLLMFSIGAGFILGRVGWNVKEVLDEQIGQTIDADIAGLAEQYAQGNIRRLVEAVERRTRQPGAGLYLVTTHAGEPIAGNITGLPSGVLDKLGLVETDYQPRGEPQMHHRALARIFALPGGFRLLVGHDIEEGDRLREILGNTLVTSLIWLVVIGALCGLLVARRVLNRIDAINANAQVIVAGDLSGRLPLAGTGDELDRLVLNLNGMLSRIGELMAGLKEVSDNIAHDLKTPLTRLRSGAERALRVAKTPDEYRAALEKVIDESDGLIRIFDALLMIARAEAGAAPEGMSDFDAGDVVRDVGELYEPAAEERGFMLATDVQSNLVLHGSRELIGQAIANLVDNALKYGVPEAFAEVPADDSLPRILPRIDLGARRVGGLVEIAVADRGPGISPADRGRVLDRFVRLENSRSRPGFGLGLSLAAAVARLHGGTIRIEDNAPGLRVVIAIPAAAAVARALLPALPRPDAAA